MDNMIMINHNGIIITPYRKKQCYMIEKSTSIYDEVYHKANETSGFYVDNYFGTGAFITYRHRYDFLAHNFPTYEIKKMPMNTPKKITHKFHINKDIVLRPLQTDIMDTIITTIHDKREWFIHLQTGQGKTLLSVHLASLFGLKTIITCFSTTVLKQWVSTFEFKSNINPDRICYINTSKILTDLIGGDIPASQYDIYICTPGILTEWCDKLGYEKLNYLFQKIGIGLMIYDEAHRNMANICKINALTNVKYTLYLSADYGQGDSIKEQHYFNIIKGATVIEPNEKAAATIKNTKLMVVAYNSHPNSIEADSIFNRYGFSSHQYMEYQLRRGIIYEVLEYILNVILEKKSDFRTLILANQINHVETIASWIREHYKDTLKVGTYHSQMEPEDKEATKNFANCIVSTYQSFGTGVDALDIKYVIGLNQSNKVEDNQAAGRARPPKDGSSPIYFMVVDQGFPYCKKKLKQRLAYLKSSKSLKDPYIYHYKTSADL